MSLPPPLPPKQRLSSDPAMRLLMPVGRSAWAIAAGYLALFSVLVIPAPLALVTGMLAVRDIRKSRTTASPKFGMGRAVFGIVMGAIGTVILVVIVASYLGDQK